MPFERYLRDHTIDRPVDQTYYYQDYRHVDDDADCHHIRGQNSYLPETTGHHQPHAVQLHIPQFMLDVQPILAPGGGAEVLPAGLLDRSPDSFASSWFANNGLIPFHSALISEQIGSGSTPDSASTAIYNTFPPNGSQRLPANFPPHFTASMDPRQRSLPEQPTPLEVTTTYIPDSTSSPPSTKSSDTTPYALSNGLVPSLPVTVPAALSLPVYSPSGFDVLSILSQVVNRPNPIIQLGPVDLSCSFVIVDVRRHDCPIVYASPTFCHLTGYREQEVLGRNCRFLQSPTGSVAKGEPRRFVSPEAVSYMRKSLSSSKECQTTLINYRKGGQAFINFVSVIPLRRGVHNTPEEADDVAYHIGFQVDLTERPNQILDKLRDGSYSVNNSPWGTSSIASSTMPPEMGHGLGQLVQAQNTTSISPKGGRHGQMTSIAVSKELRNLIADTTFTDSVAISIGTNMSGPTSGLSGSAQQGSNTKTTPLTMLLAPSSSSASMNRTPASGNTTVGSIPVSLSPSLSLLLLEFLPDFLLVLSLKGAFLYVAPSVRLVLGYEPQELVGRSISDVCHPADLVPLMRELKEGSVGGFGISGNGDVGSSTGSASNLPPKSVDLLFRALPKASTVSPFIEAKNTSYEQGDFPPSHSSASASQSPLSSGTQCSSDLTDGSTLPYIWLECRGRLHVEPGKGRKAIILSGRARWMPAVRWGSINKAGGIGRSRRQGDAHRDLRMKAGSRPSETSPGEVFGAGSTDLLEFWALLSLQGTFLVASASVRDVLGWGTSEIIGKSLWTMTRDSRSGMRERVEVELAKLEVEEARNMVDLPPTVVTTSLVHKELRVIPVQLVFYRTPRTHKYSSSSIGLTSTPHPLNNPLCPIVCQATVLSNTDQQSSNNVDTGFGSGPGHALSQVQVQMDIGSDTDKPGLLMHNFDASLFEELETARGSSWQYELQQLKFANQRLHEELHAFEGARASNGNVSASSSTVGAGHMATVPPGQSCLFSASATTIPISQQPQLHYTSLTHSTFSPSLSTLRPPNSLHEQDPPSSEWSSLAGANGQGSNPLKRSWRSEDGPTT